MKLLLYGVLIFALYSCGSKDSESKENSDSNFKWDFSQKRKFIYSFSQTVNLENRFEKDEELRKNFISVLGSLNIKVKDNNKADLSLTNMKMKIVEQKFDGKFKDTLIQEAPPMVFNDMKQNGTYNDSNVDIMFKLLLSLPQKRLSVGDFDEILLEIPLNLNNSKLFVKGKNKLVFIEYTKLLGRKCAVLKGQVDVSNLEVPDEFAGEYICTNKGEAIYYFDLEHGFFVGVDVNLEKFTLVNQVFEAKNDYDLFMETKSNNTFKIRLEKIENL